MVILLMGIVDIISYFCYRESLTLFRMGFLGVAHGLGGPFWPSIPKICHIYPTMMKLDTVIPYLREIQKIYKSQDTPHDFC